MTHTAGRWLIGIAGLIAIGAAIYRAGKGLKMDVTDEMDVAGMSAPRLRWTKRLGAVGEIGRGIAIGLIGFFLIRAAITYDSAQATGLDGALRRIADHWWGLLDRRRRRYRLRRLRGVLPHDVHPSSPPSALTATSVISA